MWTVINLCIICCLLIIKGEELTLSGSTTYAMKGESYRFTCSIKGAGAIQTIKFNRDGESVCSLILDNCRGIDSEGYFCGCSPNSIYYLEIQKVAMIDRSNWTCTDGGRNDLSSKPTPLLVYDKPRNVVLNVSEISPVVEGKKSDAVKCFSECYPKCEEIWYKENLSSVVPSKNGILSLTNINRSNAGSYFCVAYHQLLNISKRSNSINVTVYFGPDPVSLPNTIQAIKEGSNLEPIECTATCYPECKIQWFRNTICENNLLPTEDGILNMTDVVRNQSGEYICRAVHPVSFQSAVSKPLDIIIHYGPGRIKMEPNSIQPVFEGSNVKSIGCTSDCFPNCTIKWYVNSTSHPVPNGNGILSLTNIQRNQSGNYFCQAVSYDNSSNVTSESVNIEVYFGPDAINITPRVIKPVLEGDNSTIITCTAHCNPSCKYKFYKDSISMSTFIPSENGVLKLTNVYRNQSGKYVCLAEHPMNQHATLSSEVDFQVYYGPDVTKIERDSITVMEGDDVNPIKCNIDCNPPCSLTVWSDGTTIPNEHSVFSLKNIQREHSGNYTFKAYNKATAVTSDVKMVEIVVHYGPDDVILSPSSTQTVVEGSNMTEIKCEAECFPFCVYDWYRGSTMGMYKVSSSDGVLQINNVTRSQSGIYICKASNPTKYAISHSSAFNLDVVYRPVINASITYTKELDNKYYVTLNCNVDCQPPATVMWFPSTGVEDMGNTKEINNMACDEEFNFSCSVFNGVGGPVTETFSLYKPCNKTEEESTSAITTSSSTTMSGTFHSTTSIRNGTFYNNSTTGKLVFQTTTPTISNFKDTYQLPYYIVLILVGIILIVLCSLCLIRQRRHKMRLENLVEVGRRENAEENVHHNPTFVNPDNESITQSVTSDSVHTPSVLNCNSYNHSTQCNNYCVHQTYVKDIHRTTEDSSLNNSLHYNRNITVNQPIQDQPVVIKQQTFHDSKYCPNPAVREPFNTEFWSPTYDDCHPSCGHISNSTTYNHTSVQVHHEEEAEV